MPSFAGVEWCVTSRHPITTVLFDLDGTLTDPAEGITRCIQHALRRMGCTVPGREDLLCYIGPSLYETFPILLGDDASERVAEAVRHYRKRFRTLGMYENVIYPGIPEMLEELSNAGVVIYLATAKPTPFADEILQHFQIREHFSGVYGSGLDGSFSDKADLIAHLLASEGVDATGTVMVGDRMHDVRAAKRHGVASIGVTYGYGSEAELTDAGASRLCTAPHEVAGVVREWRHGRANATARSD
jgi:phosphoglycolate phosphatase